jgi:hypothetical protein
MPRQRGMDLATTFDVTGAVGKPLTGLDSSKLASDFTPTTVAINDAGTNPVEGFGGHVDEIQDNPDREGTAEACRSMYILTDVPIIVVRDDCACGRDDRDGLT